MPRPSEPTRQKILDTAYELFYSKGYTRVGMDEIAARASLTKRTLYYHYRSKDELLAAVLEHYHAMARARIEKNTRRYGGKAASSITRMFADLVQWSKTPGWTGSGFSRLVMELADLPGHPARAIAKRHKAVKEDWWIRKFSESGVPRARERAREISLLMEGAFVMMLISGDRSYAETAARAARQLLAVNVSRANRAKSAGRR
jgi:AcrR family transcriptional regulator